MPSIFASPGDRYLTFIGGIAYAVSYMEWTVIGDLSRIHASITLEDLVDRTTGHIGKALVKASVSESNPAVQDFLKVSGQCLNEASTLRNSVLHARPATIEGEQRLTRRTYNRGAENEDMTIDFEWLEATTDRLAELTREMSNARLPFD